MERVDFVFGLRARGDVRVIANASAGRSAPSPCSDTTLCDPGDGPESEVVEVFAWDDHDNEVSILQGLTVDELDRCRLAAIDEVARRALYE